MECTLSFLQFNKILKMIFIFFVDENEKPLQLFTYSLFTYVMLHVYPLISFIYKSNYHKTTATTNTLHFDWNTEIYNLLMNNKYQC